MRLPLVLVLVLALALALAPAAVAAAQGPDPTPPPSALTLEEYRGALEAVAVALEQGDGEGARALARALRSARVSTAETEFEADPSVLAAVEATRDAASDARALLTVRRVLSSLGGAGGEQTEADPALLARLAREEAARRPQAGGEIDASLEVRPRSLPQQLLTWLDQAARWLMDALARLWDWLTRTRPRPSREKSSGTTAAIVTALVAAIAVVLAVAAVRSMRRRDAAEASGAPTEAFAERDADPLSRQASEWERYAGELAAAGRRREAIRAWYHAVLVALFLAGRLHHQKGRTNWEYVAQLRPETEFRTALVGLTEVFDREWYGREASAPEALRECAGHARNVLRAVRGEAAA